KDYYEWQFTCDHRHDLVKLGHEFVSLYKKQYLYMMSVYGHSIDLENENCWGLMEEFCALVSGRDDIWFATNIEIVDYFKALDSLRFSVKGDFVENPSAATCWISVNNDVIRVDGGQKVKLT
ncbi:MAG TPA: polysaccharide deacetylase, partial [Bacillota bacterium]|nr:polysaccharide deacetylase [Bacillota bacterium]